MKLSISNIAWGVENDIEIYTILREHNYSGIEIAPTRIFPENPYSNLVQARLFSKNLKKQFNLEICSMQSILYGKSERLFGDDSERMELLSYSKLAISFACGIGCKNLVFGSPKNRVIDNDDQYPIAVSFFKQLGEFALQNGTILSIEANPPIYNTNFINTTEQAFKLVRDVNNLGFMVNLDFGTIIENQEDIAQIIKNIQLVNHIHISEPNLATIEHREIHKLFSKALKKTSYNRYVSIEMKNPNNIENIKEAINYIGSTFNEN